ncbi:acetyl esterase [Catenuloplanes nepalensis]|uniref:Acetyl esterase n=1 Tax=Catenuloplanes nepalensis TaxID=587533 RepID=A0ABT9N1Y4_9ACTN|nr:alpha/beta hydrolase [Catenuloplanes nepalensis]MDP9797508.1 acetyl esterase [Catenuloplanes nepalensis]
MIGRAEAFVLRRLLTLPAPVQRFIGGTPESGDPIDPTIAMLLRAQRWRGRTGLSAGTPARTRRRVRRTAALMTGRPTPVGTVHDVTVAGRLRGRHYAPQAPGAHADLGRAGAHADLDRAGQRSWRAGPTGSDLLVVFFHGGGFVAGDLDTHDETCRLLCAFGRMRVLSVEYRLAPESPFPAAVEDACAAVTWAFTQAPAVAVCGDSAGANLAAVVCQSLRGGERTPVAQALLYPLVDHAGTWPSRSHFRSGPVLTARDLEFFRRHYLPGPIGPDPRHSPLHAADLRGLPPAIVVTAALDPLRDEGEAYAAALRAAGVPVQSWRVPGMVHAFANLTPISTAARTAVIETATRLAEHAR